MKLVLFATIIAQLALSIAVGWQFTAASQSRKDSKAQVCDYAFALDGTIAKQIRAGEKALDSIAYYRDHPAEKQKAIDRSEASLKEFLASTPSFCERT